MSQPAEVRPAWKAGVQAFGIGVGLVVLQSIITTTAEGLVTGDEAEIWAAAIGEWIMGLLVLAVLWRLGWLRWVGVTSSFRREGVSSSGWLFAACLLPAIGVATTSWEPAGRILALAVDYLATGFYEELAFRGLISVFLVRAWRHRETAISSAAVLSGVIFGVVHLQPLLLLVGPLFAVAFTRLQIDARTIWLSMVLHAAFNWFTEFPFDADGTTTDHWAQVVAIPALVLAGVFGHRALRRYDGRSLESLM